LQAQSSNPTRHHAHFLHFINSLVVFLCFPLALVPPTIKLNVNGPTFPAALAKKASTSDSATLALASGIKDNINDQYDELSTGKKMGTLLSASTFDTNTFASSQKTLLGFVNKGISIRKNNQKTAPSGNPAISGLGVAATAQSD
jgi:hypothetical protein